MSDVKVEYQQKISRDEAAALLSQLARAFTGDGDAEFPFGPGTVKLDVPRSLRAELEVEVEDDQVEVEVEFKWLLPKRQALGPAAPRLKAAGRSPERVTRTGRQPSASRAKRK